MNYSLLNPYVRFAMRVRRGANYEEAVYAYDYRLIYVLAGECRLYTEALDEPLAPGDLAVLPPATGYRFVYQPEAPCSFVLLNFDLDSQRYGEDPIAPANKAAFDAALLFSPLRLPPFQEPLLVRKHFELRQSMEHLCDLMQSTPPFYADILSAELKAALLQVLTRQNADRENVLVAEIRRYIDLNFMLSLSNSIIAKRFGYHPYYLNQLFTTGMGQSIHAYLIGQRLRYARQLLLSTERSVASIAQECGFGGASWFSECFKARMGVTPSQYRGSGK